MLKKFQMNMISDSKALLPKSALFLVAVFLFIFLTQNVNARTDYSGWDFSNLSLTNANFYADNLSGANLRGTILTGANLFQANLKAAIYDANTVWPTGFYYQTSGAYGPNAILTNVNLSGVNLTGIDFTGANLAGANLKGAIYSTNTIWPAGFSYQTSGAYGPYANFSNTKLTGASFSGINFTGANFKGANLSGANLAGAILKGAIYSTNTIWPAGFSYQTSGAFGPNANLSGVNLTRANLSGINFTGAILNGANLTAATLTGANLTRATYSANTIWPTGFSYQTSGAYGPNANFSNTNLSGVNLSGYNFAGANFSGANLVGANLANDILTNANLTGAIYDTNTIWPTNFPYTFSGAYGPDAVFTNANLANANFSGVDLSGANFTGATLSGANFSGANLMGVNFTNAILGFLYVNSPNFTGAIYDGSTTWPINFPYQTVGAYGPGSILTNATLTNADLYGIDLSGADLRGANLLGANLSNTILTGAIYATNTVWPVGFSYQISGAYGPNAILTNATLTNADLSGVDLSGADLRGANLTGAIYATNTIWPMGFSYQISGAYGPNAILTNATLTNADLSGVDFTGANLTGANLTNAIYDSKTIWPTGFTNSNSCGAIGPNAMLTNANLSGLDLTGVDLSGVNLTNAQYNTNTIWPVGFDFLVQGALGPGANLMGRSPSSMNLSGLDFTATCFTNCNLKDYIFSGSILFGANFSGARMTSANLSNATISPGTIFPTGFNKVKAGAFVPYPAPLTQTILFPNLPKVTYGSAPIPLTATASSMLPVTYLTGDTNVASISGTSLVIQGDGTTSVSALQYGNSNYCWALPVTQILKVLKGTNTINFPLPTNVWIGVGSLTLSASCFSTSPVSFTPFTNQVASISGTTLTLYRTGTVSITANAPTSGVYPHSLSAASLSKSLIISKTNQIITFEPLSSHNYGERPFPLSATSSSGLIVSFSSSNIKAATISNNVLTITGVGTTMITAHQGGSNLYNAAPTVSQTLTIKP